MCAMRAASAKEYVHPGPIILFRLVLSLRLISAGVIAIVAIGASL
jgi:hypothetical protein